MATFEEKVLEEAYSVTPNFDVDYNDKRFADVNDAKQDALDENNELYAGMIDRTDAFYDKQIQASQDWADKQTELQNQRTDFAIEQIEQQKEQAHKDYLKEQSGAYVDWQKQSNAYGTEAEKMASAGLTSTGFAESSQVSMYNTYQNRVATARESYNRAVLNYDNAIKDAFLQNNAALAEIAYNALQKQLELSLQGFQYKNQLILDQANKKLEIDNMYWNRYQDVLDQINAENSIKADIWKYQDNQKWNTEQAELDRQFKAEEARIEREFKSAQAEIDRKHEKEMLNAKTAAEKEILAQQHKNDLAKLEKQKQNDLAVLNQKLANDKALKSYENSLNKQQIKGGSNESSYSPVWKNSADVASNFKITNTSNKNTSTGFTGSSHKDAIAYMKNKGVPSTQCSALLSESEWSRRRTAYTTYGTGNADIKNFSSYGAYLKAKVNYYVKNYGK